MINIKPLNEPKVAIILPVAIFSCHLTGLLLKIIYYKYFHVWKDITVRITPHGLKRGDEETDFINWKTGYRGHNKCENC